jgi:hypothetical protein
MRSAKRPTGTGDDHGRIGYRGRPARKSQIQIDVVVMSPGATDRPRRVLSLGEAKWDRTMGVGHLNRLARARDILVQQGFDAAGAVLACYSGSDFDPRLREEATRRADVLLVDPARLYS